MSPASGILLGREHLSGSSQEAKKRGTEILMKKFYIQLAAEILFFFI